MTVSRWLRWSVGAIVAVLIVLDVAVTVLGARRDTASPRAPFAVGVELDRPVGALPLVGADGRATSLAAFRGRWLVLAPALTLCREVCPLTTAALLRIREAARARGVGDRVAVAEVTVDPWRDSPARIRAFHRRTGSDVPFLTGSHAQIARVWRTFGVDFHRVVQGDPPDVDPLTHRPERFDVAHTDGLFIVDPRGRLRVAVTGPPDVGGSLPSGLAAQLGAAGRAELRRPQASWTVDDVVTDLWHVMGLSSPPVRPPTPAQAQRMLAGSPGALAALHAEAGRLLGGGKAAFRARLAALRGHPVVVNEWASWCPPCRTEFPLFAAASARLGRAVGFLGLNVSDGGTGAQQFLRSHPVSYPSIRDDDGAIARSLARSVGLPTTLFLDRSGHVSGVHLGVYHDLDSLLADIRREAHATTP